MCNSQTRLMTDLAPFQTICSYCSDGRLLTYATKTCKICDIHHCDDHTGQYEFCCVDKSCNKKAKKIAKNINKTNESGRDMEFEIQQDIFHQ